MQDSGIEYLFAKTTKMYLGDNFKAFALAAKDFLLQVPNITPNDLEGIPFLPSGVPLEYHWSPTPESLELAYQKFEAAVQAFVAETQLLDPANYLDSVMSQYINISRHHLAILHEDIKGYYMSQPDGNFKAQMYEKFMGNLAKTPTPTPSSEPMDPEFIGKYLFP